jgi:peptidyl-Asp metalloendopeptidase
MERVARTRLMLFLGRSTSKLRLQRRRAILTTLAWTMWSVLLVAQSVLPALAQQSSFVEPAGDTKLTPRQNEILSAIKDLPSTQEATVVRLNTDALRAGDLISIPLSSKSVLIQNKSRESQGESTIWSGAAPNAVSGSTTIVVNNQNVTGSIQTSEGSYRIRPLGEGLHALIKVNTKSFPPEHPPSPRQ